MSKRLSSQVQGHGLGGWAGDQNPWATPGAPWKPQQEMFPCPIAILAQAPCHTVLILPLSVPQLSPGTMWTTTRKGCLHRVRGCASPCPSQGLLASPPALPLQLVPQTCLPPISAPFPMGVCNLQEHRVVGGVEGWHTLTVDAELDGSLCAGVQAAIVGQAGVQACVGAAGAGDGVGRPSVDLRVVLEPHVVTRGVGRSQAAESDFFLLAGPETFLGEARRLHGDHRLVWTVWGAGEAVTPVQSACLHLLM